MIKILNQGNTRSGDENSDIVGELKNGRQVDGKPESLDYWIIRTDDPEVGDSLAAHFGVELEETDYERKPYQVSLEEGVEIPLVINRLRTAMILKSQKTWKTIRQCDGETMTDGKDCLCAATFGANSPEFWEASGDGLACKPDGFIAANIVGLEELGTFILSKNSRSTVSRFDDLEEAAVDEGLEVPYTTSVSIERITSKKSGFSWTVPTFSHPEEAE